MNKFTDYNIEYEALDHEYPSEKDYILYGNYETDNKVKMSVPIFAARNIQSVAEIYERITGVKYHVD